MPSVPHTFLVDLFRENPELLPTILREVLHVPVPAYTEITAVNADFTELPPEFRADLVLVLSFRGQPVLVVIIEVQLGRDERKRRVWPAYVAIERARRGCPACLLVVTLAEDVATWAGQTIVDGNPGGISLRPLLAGPGQFPALTAPQAAEEPELAMFGVLAHQTDPRLIEVADEVLCGFKELPDDRRKVYSELIFALLREACHKGLLETQMLSSLMEKYRKEFKGFYEEGETKGETKGKAEAVLSFLRARGLDVPEAAQQRILSCKDLGLLDRWIVRAATITTADDLFLDS